MHISSSAEPKSLLVFFCSCRWNTGPGRRTLCDKGASYEDVAIQLACKNSSIVTYEWKLLVLAQLRNECIAKKHTTTPLGPSSQIWFHIGHEGFRDGSFLAYRLKISWTACFKVESGSFCMWSMCFATELYALFPSKRGYCKNYWKDVCSVPGGCANVHASFYIPVSKVALGKSCSGDDRNG